MVNMPFWATGAYVLVFDTMVRRPNSLHPICRKRTNARKASSSKPISSTPSSGSSPIGLDLRCKRVVAMGNSVERLTRMKEKKAGPLIDIAVANGAALKRCG